MTSNSLWILSSSAASGEMKFFFIGSMEPNDRFHTLISRFCETALRMERRMVKELNRPFFATPKCFTLNRPQPSSSVGLIVGPSTIIEVTSVP